MFDNIAHGLVGTKWESAARDEQMALVVEAAKTAYAHDFITELPNGYDTEIGQRGGLLSGGQKQRVAIARSVVSQPKVLLLDEATSALDPHAEGIVQQALDRAAEGRTTIVIAHKLATIKKAHNIVVMSKGRIVEQGAHADLVARDGVYAQLVRVQNLLVSAAKASGVEDESDEDDAARLAHGEGDDKAALTKTLTRYATAERERMQTQKDRDDYERHSHLGLLSVVVRLIRDAPELRGAYIFVLLACLGSCKSPDWRSEQEPLAELTHPGAAIPGQAILLANMTDVFTLTGAAMVDKGNFFAAMFIVLAAGCFICYFTMGYSTNTVAQVRPAPYCPLIITTSYSRLDTYRKR